jgi:hypothetical protein
MPWRGPEYAGEYPTLGFELLDWAEATFQVPDGPLAGEPLRLTDEQARIVCAFYELDDRGKFVFRRAAVRRAQGWGKSPLLALIGLAELCGPSRFDGWDARGEPVGRPPETPWVQVAAVSEDQTANTFNALHTMAGESDLNGTVLDVGLTRVFLRGETGRLEPVTAAAGTRLGQRVTFASLDETHLWTRRNGGLKLAATIRRNASKMGGRTFESTNAHEPGEDSVAERTYTAAQAGADGLYYDSAEGPEVDDLSDRRAVLAALRVAYGDSRWVDLERLADEISDPGTEPNDARRFYLNQLVSGSGCPVDIRQWESLARPDIDIPDRSRIAAGFDGSIGDDSTVLYVCTPEGHIAEFAVWERPEDAPASWRVPRREVHEAVAELHARFKVGHLFADPPMWYSEIEGWQAKYGDHVLGFSTNQARTFAPACMRFATAVREGTLSHDGKPGLTRNLAACAKKRVRLADDEDDQRSPWVVVKADRRKIDRAVGAILAYEAASTMPAAKPHPRFINLAAIAEQLRREQAA